MSASVTVVGGGLAGCEASLATPRQTRQAAMASAAWNADDHQASVLLLDLEDGTLLYWLSFDATGAPTWSVGVAKGASPLGAVIEKADGTIYGLDVILAAHIESLAEPGGTTISEGVHRRVVGKVGRDFQDIGEHQVKNLAKLVRAYSASPGPAECRRGAQAHEAGVHA